MCFAESKILIFNDTTKSGFPTPPPGGKVKVQTELCLETLEPRV